MRHREPASAPARLAMSEEMRRYVARRDRRRVCRDWIVIPAWVPPHLRPVYLDTARLFDEFEAASHVRSLKREGEAR